MIHTVSSAAYTVLKDENVFCLVPSTSTLQKVARHMGDNNGVDNLAHDIIKAEPVSKDCKSHC